MARRRWSRRSSTAGCLGRAVALAAVLAHGAAIAGEDTWVHRGALGLTVAGGGEFDTSIVVGQAGENRLRAPMELGGTLSVTEHTEVRLTARVAAPGPTPDWSVYLGIRNYRGDRVKTFFDLDVAAHVYPAWSLGLRGGFGVQYEISPVVGAFAVAGLQGGGGAGLRIGFELLVGLQLRTYVFQ